MGKKVKGLLVEIGGDTSALQKSLNTVNKSTSNLSKELRGVNSLLKFDPKSTELLAQKQTILNENIKQTQQKLDTLQKAKEEADNAMANGTKISEDGYRGLQREIINTQNKLNQLKTEASNWTKVGKSIEEVGNKISNLSNKGAQVGGFLTKTVSTSLIGASVAAVKAMNDVDDGLDIIETKTGATGEQWQELQDIFRDVSSNVPANLEDIGAAIGEINTRLDLTGDSLKNASFDFLKFAKVNGTDVNSSVQLVTRAMGDAGIKTENYKELLDMLTVAGQKSGISIDSLATNLAKYGAPMRALGIDTKNAIAMFAGWEKAGVNTEIAFSGMKKAISNWGAAGKDSTKEFSKTLDEIAKCPTIAKATTKAIEVFGAKAGPDLADAIKGGRFEFQKYVDALENGTGTLDSTYSMIVDDVDEAELAMQKMKLALHDTGEIIAKTVGPVVSDLAGDFQELMKKFDKLDPAMKKNILKWGAIAIAVGPAISVISKAGNIIGSVTKGVGIFSQAIGVAKNNTTSTVLAVNNLAQAFKLLKNPVGLALSAITAVTAAVIYFSSQQNEAQKEAEEFSKKIQENKNSFDEYNKTINDNLKSDLAQIDSTKKLRKELSELVDENGKVKEGYESRVQFILKELNGALGTEYELNGDIIKNYQQMQKEIDNLIEKRKAEIHLKAEEEKYSNVIKKEGDAVKDLKDALTNLNNLQKEYGTNLDGLQKKVETLNSMKDNLWITGGSEVAKKQYEKEANRIQDTINAYKNSLSVVQECTEEKKKYEGDYALFVEGKYQEIGKNIKNITQDWCNATIESIKTSIQEQGTSLELYKQIYEQTGNEVALQNMQQIQNNLSALADELVKRTQTITELSPSEIEAWKNLADNSYGEYSRAISQMAPEMQQKIQEATGVIAAGTPQMQEKAKELGNKTIEEFDKNSDARSKALKTMQGYLNGLSDEDKRELLKQAGIDDVDKFLKELDKGSLSEDCGKNLLKGLWNGLQDGTWQGRILGTASGLASSVNKCFTGKKGWDIHSPSRKMRKFVNYYLDPIPTVFQNRKREILNVTSRMAKDINSSMQKVLQLQSSINLEGVNSKINKIMLNSTRIIYTTPQMIFNFQKLDESNLKIAFDYVNKRLGSYY